MMKIVAPGVAVVMLVIVAILVFIYEGDGDAPVPEASPLNSAPNFAPAVTQPITTQPAAEMSTQAAGSTQVAPILGDLVVRIEAKVKADPSDVGNQILLAQTYAELGRTDEGVAILRGIAPGRPGTERVNVVLASLLIKSGKKNELIEALKLLDMVGKVDSTQRGFTELYRGRAYLAQGKKDVALKAWASALKKLAPDDNARTQIEDEIAKAKAN